MNAILPNGALHMSSGSNALEARNAFLIRDAQDRWGRQGQILNSTEKVIFADSTQALLADHLARKETLPADACVPTPLFSYLTQPL
ncbi:hypothetical protein [Reticulibacter mediterranei]|uniref:hypothetical protein n=1 Tax=Reticulibacter mediterranei TaxID=2778369 RepID=UPI001C68AB6C|nr:hypothetical protein [Reticulibacter mediterranei]